MLATLLVPIVVSCAPKPEFKAADTFTVDVSQRRDISPYIYGANSVDWGKLPVAITVNRLGGNRMTAYNWETNASNAGSDWHFQNDGYMGESNEPGFTLRKFMEGTQAHGAATLITIPTSGYVSADKKGDGDVRQTPDYLNVRFDKSVARKPGGHFAYPPDTSNSVVYQDECVAWLEKIRKPTPPVWYILDNEPDIWAGTHAEIVRQPVTYAGIVANNIEYASAIKAVAPKALVFGWSSYGWNGYRTFQGAPDAQGRDFLEFYLTSMKDAESKTGKRLLDVLDLHWYPEARGGGQRITEEDKPGTAEARIQAPRSLWDPTYVEDSWITQSIGKKPIMLLPRTNEQIERCYPGTKLAFNEYNYGGGKEISGAIAQADVLGLFGRYGVFCACNWGLSPGDTAEIAGYNAFLNFDGSGAKFGDQELGVSGGVPEKNSLYAARDSARLGRMTLVAINKTDRPDPIKVVIGGLSGAHVRAFAVTSDWMSTPKAIDADFQSGGVTFVAPPLSVVSVEVLR